MAGRTRLDYGLIISLVVIPTIGLLVALVVLVSRQPPEQEIDYVEWFTKIAWRINSESDTLSDLYDNPKPKDEDWNNKVKIAIFEMETAYQSFIDTPPSKNANHPTYIRIKTNIQVTCGNLIREYTIRYSGITYSDSQLEKLKQLNRDCGGFAVLSIAELNNPEKTYYELLKPKGE